jgi:hypothetical protein
MAGGSARKRAEENAARLNLLKAFVLVGAGTFIAARLLLFKGSTTLGHWLGFAATLLLDALAYGSIAFAARPTYDGAGNLIDGGANLNKACHVLAKRGHSSAAELGASELREAGGSWFLPSVYCASWLGTPPECF